MRYCTVKGKGSMRANFRVKMGYAKPSLFGGDMTIAQTDTVPMDTNGVRLLAYALDPVRAENEWNGAISRMRYGDCITFTTKEDQNSGFSVAKVVTIGKVRA